MIHQVRAQADIQLPNELLSAIVSELASDTENNSSTQVALASCRLASHVLCSLATPLLFSSIELRERPKAWMRTDNERLVAFTKQATKLYQLLSTNPDVTASVRTFTLRYDSKSLENARVGTLISTILYRLPHLRNFTLGPIEEWEFSSKLLISSNLLPAIHAMCKLPNFTSLDLSDIESFPITAITASPNLRYFRLSRVTLCFDNVIPMDENSSLQPFYMDSLEMDNCSTSSLMSGISRNNSLAKYFSRIRNLQLRDLFVADAAVRLGWDIILLASQSLTTLGLHLHLISISYSIAFDLGRLPALRHFEIQLPVSHHYSYFVLSFLNRLLSVSSSTSGIETLVIKITWKYIENQNTLKDLFSSNAEWSTLDEALASEKFVSLSKVVLSFGLETSYPYRNLEHRIPSYVDDLFPMTRSQHTLETHVKFLNIFGDV